jgi:hypothetical protein
MLNILYPQHQVGKGMGVSNEKYNPGLLTRNSCISRHDFYHLSFYQLGPPLSFASEDGLNRLFDITTRKC